MNPVRKVLAYVVRPARDGGHELLAFRHPLTGAVEVVRGTVEPGEELEPAVLRELLEESGLREVTVRCLLGESIRQVKSGPDGAGPPEPQAYSGFLLDLTGVVQDTWVHRVQGAGLDEGISFAFSWFALDEALDSILKNGTGTFLPELRRTLATAP